MAPINNQNSRVNIFEIIDFSDGKDKYKEKENRWMIIETMFEGDKIRLKNCKDETIISSISAWKVIKIE